MFKLKRFWPAGLAMVLLLLAGTACEARGVPGSRLLTPIGQAVVVTATPQPSPTVEPTDLPQSSDTPAEIEIVELPSASASSSATPTLIPTDTFTPTESGTPTFGPSPTNTRTPTRTRRPTNTRYPTRTPRPTNTPTVTMTPTPDLALMRFQKPGPYSKVSSPIDLEALITPGDDGYVYVQLIGEDGRIITRQALDFRNYLNRHFYISPEIPFEIKAAAETARLEVSIQDNFGRPIYAISVDLVLLSLGDSEIYPVNVIQEPYLIRSPQEGAAVSGGVLKVSGLAAAVNDQPLQFELIDESGQVVGSASQDISQPYGDLSHVPFEVYIPYKINQETGVRLTIRQDSGTRVPGTVWLESMLLTLEP